MPFRSRVPGCAARVLCVASCLQVALVHADEPPAVGAPWPVTARPGAASGAVTASPLAPSCSVLSCATPLTLATLSDFALRHNPATREAWAGASADLAGIAAARALFQPTLALGVPLSLDHGAAPADATGAAVAAAPAASGVVRSVSPSLTLSWVLFDFGARAAGVDAARWQAAASQLGYNRTLQTVVSAVEQAYYAVLGARQTQAALQVSVQAARASLDSAQARRHAGLATVGDTAQAEAALADATLQQVRAQASTRSAEGALANAVGLPVQTALNLADDAGTPSATPSTSAMPRVDELLATARTSRADLIASNALVQQGDAQLAAAQAQGRPSFALSASVGKRWGSDADNPSTQHVALTLSVPLFDGGLVRAQTQAARARVEQLAAQRDQQRLSVELDVWQSFQDADSAQAVIDGAEALLRSATVAEAAARERYGAGLGSLLELLVAQSTAAQARVSAVQARYDARLAVARLGLAVGTRLPAR